MAPQSTAPPSAPNSFATPSSAKTRAMERCSSMSTPIPWNSPTSPTTPNTNKHAPSYQNSSPTTAPPPDLYSQHVVWSRWLFSPFAVALTFLGVIPAGDLLLPLPLPLSLHLSSSLELQLTSLKPCHPERSRSRTVRTAPSKDLWSHFLLP
jgi:hypothetical protein